MFGLDTATRSVEIDMSQFMELFNSSLNHVYAVWDADPPPNWIK